MDPVPQPQTSFIPRKPITRESSIREKPVSVFLVIATILFLISILSSAGVFLYKYLLTKNIQSSSEYLDKRRSAFEPETINHLIQTDRQLRAAQEVLGRHLAVTPVFSFVERNTLRSVRFSSFEYTNDDSGGKVRLEGEAKGYESVALQSQTLNQNSQLIRSAVFSDLNLGDKGQVTFDATILLDPDLTNYKKSLEVSGEPVIE